MRRMNHEQDDQYYKDHPMACIDFRNNQSELISELLMSQMRMSGTESVWHLSKRKLKVIQEQMKSEILSKSNDALSDTAPIPANNDPALKMRCTGESSTVSNIDTFTSAASSSTTRRSLGTLSEESKKAQLQESVWKRIKLRMIEGKFKLPMKIM